MPGLGIIGRHSHALLGSRVKFVEQVSVDADSCCDHKIAGAGIALKIRIFHATKSDTARGELQRRFCCRDYFEWKPQIVR